MPRDSLKCVYRKWTVFYFFKDKRHKTSIFGGIFDSINVSVVSCVLEYINMKSSVALNTRTISKNTHCMRQIAEGIFSYFIDTKNKL